ncbi:mucin-2 [Lutzomyia longipalpis]|uniref:mucin-2 n=1 Tax=Lutzomyia longipalpis TaxID=7200 RepID=UPI0024834583|nr:mucin-2 [Lutzomyia longipalpis]XP_055678578.1 mucin-2 [Lutzomyia longipalpis]
MPFVQRVVSPVYVARSKGAKSTPKVGGGANPEAGCSSVQCGDAGDQIAATQKVVPVSDHELEAVTNVTLSNALKQLASLVLIANDIFTELNAQLQSVSDRSRGIKSRIDALEQRVEAFDPKTVPVPEGDLATFVHIKNHFRAAQTFATALFTPATRSAAVRNLYEAAAKTPVSVMREMDTLLGQDERRASLAEIFMCTPVLGQTRRRMRRNIDVEIETRMPAALDDLRKWTSLEAIGDITVTPDCVARVGFAGQLNATDASGGHPAVVVTPCTPPSGDEDEPDDITVISSQRIHDSLPATPDDMPLDHRLPSPEEQCKILALKFPAEVVSVDISGKRFDRMCHTRKSLLHTQIAGSASESGVSSPPSDSIDNQTVKRRSRPKKPRGKRRNTLAGTDQKEIQEAANGEPETVTAPDDVEDLLMIVPRSKSSDIFKRDPFDSGRTLSTHFNSLKQWGMNRLRMYRNSSEDRKEVSSGAKSSDIDDFNVHESIGIRNRRKLGEKERKLLHERKPSYSSSEKSISIASPASINPVKLRESSSIRRQRRIGHATREEPNSSSGNWSASSESGRTSIGSEITAQPKSSASSNSLNHNHHPGSGPPSSIISRRRFLNTSASSSVTSEGTATPDLQGHEMFYDDGETSSAYSCDTEGYYTSFHVDSGLKTLKEEEPVTPLHTSSALSSTNSFSSSGNQTVLSAENEYELFGKGSTSTTTSSAGTVCTTLKAAGSDRSLIVGPTVPERKSSLTKLNRSSSTNSGGTLERSYSSSTVGSTLERTGTIKRNGVLLQKEVAAVIHQHQQDQQKEARTDSPDSGNNTSSSPVESNANSSPTQGVRSYSEFEYSESSDLEGVDRIERIRSKTTINSSRIPSMCVITPTNSDDEYQAVIAKKTGALAGSAAQRQKLEIPLQETDLDSLQFNKASEKADSEKLQIITVNQSTGYATVQTIDTPKSAPPIGPTKPSELKKEVQYVKKTTLLPLNSMLGRLKGVLPTLSKMKSPQKDTPEADGDAAKEPDTSGEYVTIADVKNNNKTPGGGVYYTNDVVKRNLATVLSGNLAEETEYVSLNELPANMRCESNLSSPSITSSTSAEKKIDTETENDNRRGARVMLDAQGKVVYSSDSLKRRKGAHTTFAPGPCVKDTQQGSQVSPSGAQVVTPGGLTHRKPTIVRPVPALNPARRYASENQATAANEPLNEDAPPSDEEVKTPPPAPMLPFGPLTGAYVNLQCEEDTYLPPPPPHLAAPMVSANTGYLPSYPDDTRTHLATLPRAPAMCAPPAVYESVGSTYWTLQARKPPVEALYSTPNKPKRTPLKTTPLGFETFFSPVKESSVREESPTESPIDPRSGGSMRTSTPSRDTPRSPTVKPSLADELRTKLRIQEGVRSNGNSPSSSGRSTPRGILEPQQPRGRHSWAADSVEIPQTCSDRMGAPKTSLMDFKRLLLAKAGKNTAVSKPSAVEQLLKKPPPKVDVASPVKPSPLNTSLKIQDLSGSPKTFASRRMIRQGNFGGSPAKGGLGGGKHMSPRSVNWRLNSATKHDVMSTSIPEANSEEDNSSSPGSSTRRSSMASTDEAPPVDIKAETKNVVEEIVKMKDNIFLKAEENNFMKHEMVQKTPTYASNRSQMLQAQRTQFLMGLNPAAAPPKGAARQSPEPVAAKPPPSLETAL